MLPTIMIPYGNQEERLENIGESGSFLHGLRAGEKVELLFKEWRSLRKEGLLQYVSAGKVRVWCQQSAVMSNSDPAKHQGTSATKAVYIVTVSYTHGNATP